MKITKVVSELFDLRLDTPYAIAYETVSSAINLLIEIHTDRGIVGMGLAAPDHHVTGENPQNALCLARDFVSSELKGKDPLRPARLMNILAKPLKDWPSLRSGIDIALFDIMGKTAGIPLYKLLGGYRDRMMTSITIGILEEADTVRIALEYARKGFKALKLKGGLDVDGDIARTLKVREAVDAGIALRFDANQGYRVEDAIRFVEQTRKAHVEVLEQPTPKGAIELLGKVTQHVQVPVMADECLLSLRDALRLAKGGLADMVNVKLTKVGGIQEASAINAVARAAGLEAMVGCMDELSLGIAAGLSFACARPNVTFADLDGHIGLKEDPTRGSVTLKDGVLYPSREPGLGLGPFL